MIESDSSCINGSGTMGKPLKTVILSGFLIQKNLIAQYFCVYIPNSGYNSSRNYIQHSVSNWRYQHELLGSLKMHIYFSDIKKSPLLH